MSRTRIDSDRVPAPDVPAPDGDEVTETALVVRVAGEVDLVTAEHASDRLRAAEAVAVAGGPAVVVLDLTEVTFLGSVGLAMMVEHHRLCAELGTRLTVIAGANRATWRSIRLSALDQVLTIVSSVDEAVGRG